MAIKRILKINNSWPELFNFQNSFNGHYWDFNLVLEYLLPINAEDAPRYRLVVICGSDNEYRSRIVASLDKYRRPAIPVNLEYLKEYVSKKLQVNEFVPEIKPAACVDFNK